MGICKNIECENDTTKNNIYCSLSCRSYYVNKYLRDHSKNAKSISDNSKKKYELNIKYCKNPNCEEKIPYIKRKNKYCDNSCSASHNNTGKKHTNKTKEKIKQSSFHFKEKYNENPKMCKNCNKPIIYKKRTNIHCSEECVKIFKRKDLSEYKKYKLDCKFNFSLKDYPEEFNFKLIEKYGWYKAKNRGDNLDGISRDHMYSIKEGFNNNIKAEIISHPANCKLIQQRKNSSKHTKCSISLEYLKIEISNWSNKY